VTSEAGCELEVVRSLSPSRSRPKRRPERFVHVESDHAGSKLPFTNASAEPCETVEPSAVRRTPTASVFLCEPGAGWEALVASCRLADRNAGPLDAGRVWIGCASSV